MYNKINDILYEKFGAFSKYSYNILELAVKNNINSLHELVRLCGFSYKFVREIFYLLDENVKLEKDCFNLEDLKSIIDEQKKVFDDTEQRLTCQMDTIINSFKYNDANLDHIAATPETCSKRAHYLFENYDVERAHILFLGDHDLTSIALALLCVMKNKKCSIYVTDIDNNILGFISEKCNELGLSIYLSHADFRYSISNTYFGKMDVVFTDPPYTPEGMGVFLNAGIQCLKNNPFSTVCISYKTAEMSNKLGVLVQKEIMKRKLYISSIQGNFNCYYCAEALGYRSDLYICRVTPDSFKTISKQEYISNIYTHGTDAVESVNFDNDYEALFKMIVKENGGKNGKKISFITSRHKPKTIHETEIMTVGTDVFIRTKLNGMSNINDNNLILIDCSGDGLSYKFKTLLLMNYREYYCIIRKEQEEGFEECFVNRFLDRFYKKEKITHSLFIIYKYARLPLEKGNGVNILYQMYNSVRSGVINSFKKSACSLYGITKNEAKEMFYRMNLNIDEKLPLFFLSESDLKALEVQVLALD